ncbi:MAG: hypothetical protein AABX71_02585, partial [Nanoarchaeota archaeon]
VLSQFLGKFGRNTFGATSNKTEAELYNRTYVNLGDVFYSDFTMILFRKGEESGIKKIGANLYSLEYKNCEIIDVTERFMVAMYAQATGNELK